MAAFEAVSPLPAAFHALLALTGCVSALVEPARALDFAVSLLRVERALMAVAPQVVST